MGNVERKPAWVVRIWTDADGKRKKEKAKPGVAWVKPDYVFVVVAFDKRIKKLSQEKIAGAGREAKRAADDRAAEINQQMRAGTYAPPADWSAARKQYERDELPFGRREATIADIKSALDRFEAICHPQRLDRITSQTLAQFRAARQTGDGKDRPAVGERTVNKDLRYLRAFFYKLEEWGILVKSPIVSLVKEPESERGPYVEAEFAKLYGSAGIADRPRNLPPATRELWWRTLLLFMWSSGGRRSEFFEIEWEKLEYDFDFKGNSRVELPGRKTKTGKARYLHFTADVASHLRELAGALFPAGSPAGKVFIWPTDERQLIVEIDRIHAAAGVERLKYRAFHGFRHSCGTEVYRTHGPIAAQHRLGHSNAKITERYARTAMAGFAAASSPPMPQLPQRTALKVCG